MQGTVGPDAVVVRPLLLRLSRRRERRDRLELLRILDDESPAGLAQGHHVVTLAEKPHLAIQGPQHLGVCRQFIRVEKRFTCDRRERGIEDPVPHPAGTAMLFVAVIDRERPLEDRLELIAGPIRFKSFVSARRHVPDRPPCAAECRL